MQYESGKGVAVRYACAARIMASFKLLVVALGPGGHSFTTNLTEHN